MKILAEKAEQCKIETIAFLHDIWELREKGRPIQPNPFYERDSLLTKQIIDDLIANIELLFVNELKKFRGYHNNAQGISVGEVLVPPGLDTLTDGEKRAVVQGIDKIFNQFRAPD